MTVSVVLCTYNGCEFLQHQLESLSSQTVVPDEVIVRDDCSTDDTFSVLSEWQRKANAVVTVRNESNIGVTGNFDVGIRHTTGDLVFCCDQDDVWEGSKVETLKKTFDGHPEVGFVFSDAVRVDEHGHELMRSLWESLPACFDEHEQEQFRETGFHRLLRSNVVTGCTMAFRAEYKDLVLPIPDGWVHDAWIALCISAVSRGLPVAEKLVRYRQHSNQQIGERHRGFLAQYRMAARMGRQRFEQDLAAHHTLLERLTGQNQWPVSEDKLTLVRSKIRFLEDRVRMRDRFFRSPLVLRNWLRQSYTRFAYGWKSVAQDLLIRR